MSSSQPPPYVEFPTSPESVLFSHWTPIRSPSQQQPTVQDCITHLKLLKAFHRLHKSVSSEEGLFGISDPKSLPPSTGKIDCKDLGMEAARRRAGDRRWAVFVARAAERFEVWWERVIPRSNKGKVCERLKMNHMVRKELFEMLPQMAKLLVFTPDLLPPLDVLLVWHSYMLAPRKFLEDCLRYSKMDFWATGLPWEVIASCLDGYGDYQPGASARHLFESRTGQAWDSRMDSPSKTLLCPKDGSKIICPWTTYAAPQFREVCPACGTVITHDVLTVHRLRSDADDFMLNNHPMPGTVLSSEGLPHSPSSISRYPPTFPNRIISQGGFMTRIATMAHSELEPCMEDMKDWIQGEIERGEAVKKANHRLFSGRLGAEEEASIGRMLDCYWDNHSKFSTDLAGAVLRYKGFVSKICEVGWLSKDGLNARMWRGLQKFDRLFQMMAKHPEGPVVPTLDVEFAWLTYLLFPQDYYFFTVKMTRTLVAHFGGNAHGADLEWTEKMYVKLFGEKYVDEGTQLGVIHAGHEKDRVLSGIGRWGTSASFPVASMEL